MLPGFFPLFENRGGEDVLALHPDLIARYKELMQEAPVKKAEKDAVLRAYFRKIGKKGGSKMTPKKLAALKKNARKKRPGRKKSI